MIAFRDLHSHWEQAKRQSMHQNKLAIQLTPRTGSLLWEESRHTRIIAANHNTGRVCHLSVDIRRNYYKQDQHIPQILIGASSSNNTGCWMKISRDFVHSHFISFSVKFTCLPGLAPLTANSCSITLSTSTSLDSAIVDTSSWLREGLKWNYWRKQEG